MSQRPAQSPSTNSPRASASFTAPVVRTYVARKNRRGSAARSSGSRSATMRAIRRSSSETGASSRSGPSQGDDHVRDPGGQDPFLRLQVGRDALRTQTGLLDGPVGEHHRRSEERRVGKSVDYGGRRINKKER